MRRGGEIVDENASVIGEALSPSNFLFMLKFLFLGFSGAGAL